WCDIASKSPDRRKYSSGGGGRFEKGSTAGAPWSGADPCETRATPTLDCPARISLVYALSRGPLGVERSTQHAARRRHLEGPYLRQMDEGTPRDMRASLPFRRSCA